VSGLASPPVGRGPSAGREPAANPDDAYRSLLECVQFRPVFLLGDHRTGTTLLYQLLARTGCFNFVTAYHVIKYRELIHNRLTHEESRVKRELGDCFEGRGLRDRLLDGVQVTPDLPEEYGFVLRAGGSRTARLTPAALPTLKELCRKVRFLAGVDRPVLLKNPWDYSNFVYLKEAAPEAKFVFIHRHPVRVIDSQLRATRSLFEARNPYIAMLADWYARDFERPLRRRLTRLAFAWPLGFRVVLRHVRRANRYFLDHVPALPDPDHVSVRYEDLCASPAAAVARVLTALGMDATPGVADRPRIKVREAPLLPEVGRNRDRIARVLAHYCSHWGYVDA
jgi:hypothetical protein